MFPVKLHYELLSKQFLAPCQLPEHPYYGMTTDMPPSRNIRQDIPPIYEGYCNFGRGISKDGVWHPILEGTKKLR